MPASQTAGFGNFLLERSVGMPAGYQIPALGCPPGAGLQQQQAQHLAAMAAAGVGLPITYAGLQGYSFIPYPHHRPVTHVSNGFDLKASSPYHHALLARAGAFYPPYRAGAADDPGRVAKVATRESTGALKAWLNEHLKNPYPTKGEKIMLAIITKMSLTQVSTWFANARRRLKKENRVSWASKGKSDEEDEEPEGGSDDEEEEEDHGSPRKCQPENRDEVEEPQRGSRVEQVESALGSSAPADARLEAQPASGEREGGELGLGKVERSESDRAPSALETKENGQRPKIWSLAETATSESAKKPLDNVYKPAAGRLWAEWASRHGLLAPSGYTSHETL